ncbi:MAG TPA: hypothetical protein VHO84_11215 [Syntrophorhabdaceae bacterium]|nr:hypothetical protein [Syntrophorhabdaceae bacterium]
MSNAGWKIDGIKARYAFFCRAYEQEKDKFRRDFGEGQFEDLFKSFPTVELIFHEGIDATELFALNIIVEEIQRKHPELAIRISEMTTRGSQTRVAIETNLEEHVAAVSDIVEKEIEETFRRGIPLDVLTKKINDTFLSSAGVEIGPVSSPQPVSVQIKKREFSLIQVSPKSGL